MDQTASVQEYLRSLVEHSTPKYGHYIQVNGQKSLIHTVFSPPIALPAGCTTYEIACTGVETYYTFPNINSERNGSIKVSVDAGTSWTTITIPTGSYELSAINATLKRLIAERIAGGKESNLCLVANNNTLQSVLILEDKVQVDFNVENSICEILGFDKEVKNLRGPGRFSSTHIVKILRVNSILVNCDIIKSSTKNGTAAPIIYDFFPNVGPGQKIVSRPRVLIYLPLTMNVISRMTTWLTDQNGELLDLREEGLTITFHVRAC